MKWQKKGLIYGPDGSMPWAKHTALTPTPILLDPDTIRVYAGFRDEKGVSRIGYVDVDANSPAKIRAVSRDPVLDVGRPGAFDDNGVILGDIVHYNGQLWMYYVGFQLVEKVKFLAFTGLAVSKDGGDSFTRHSHAPIMDRSNDALYIKAIHSVIIEDGIWKVWCGVGDDWKLINGKPFPSYNIRFYTSLDGFTFSPDGLDCITFLHDEYRIGRPRVIKDVNTYKMLFTKGTLSGAYLPGYAESADCLRWHRLDDQVGIAPSDYGWDSRTLCYPTLITVNARTYMFYNGNDMGKDGFGFAELAD